MDWSAATLWWLAAGALVAAELVTGTFYLLMIALGAASGAVAGHAGLALPLQIVTAALVGGGATALWHVRQRRHPRVPAGSDPDVNPDIGRHVRVEAWDSDGTARVVYRGAAWSVRHAGGGAPAPGEHTIVAVDGSQLQVRPRVRN